MPDTRSVIFHDLPDIPGVRAVEGKGVTNEFPRHVHRRYVLGIMDGGERKTDLSGKAVDIPAGNLFLLEPGTPHICRTRDNHYRVLAVTPERMREAAHGIYGEDTLPPKFTAITASNPDAALLFDHIFESIRDDTDTLQTESLLADLLLLILSLYAETPASAPQETTEHAAVQRAKNFLRTNFQEKIRLHDIADAACLSPFRLQRVFTTETGISPHEYLIQCRIRRARILLGHGSSPAEIALALGFYDQSHFTTHFRRITGVPPKKFSSRND